MSELIAARRKSGRNGRLAALAEARGITLEALLVDTVTTTGSIAGAARTLEVNVNTVRHYLAKYGIALTTQTQLRRIGA